MIYQAGAMAGWRALTLFLPARDCSVVVICNRADVSASEAARTAARKVYSIAPLATLEPRPIPEEMVGWWSDDLIGNVVRFVSRDDGGEFRGSVETVALVGLGGSSARDRDRDVIWRLHGRGNDALLEQVGRGEHRALYRRAEPWRPSSLDAFAGRYASDEAAFSIDVEPAKQPLLVDFGALGRRQAWPTVERCFFGGFPGRLYPIRFSLRFDTHEPAGAAELSVPGAHRILLRRRP